MLFSLIGDICFAQNVSQVKADNVARSNWQIDSLISLSEQYSITRPKKARTFALQALEIAEKTKGIEQQAVCRLSIAKSYKTVRDYNSILQTLNPLLANLNEIDNYDIVAEILNSIGIAHYQLGHDTIPLSKYINEKNLDRTQSDLESISLGLKAIGRFYSKIGSNEKAIEFLKKSVRIDSIIGNPEHLGESILLLAKANIQAQNIVTAETLLQESLFNLKKVNRPDLNMEAYTTLAEICALSNPLQSQEYLNLALAEKVPIDSFRVTILKSLIQAASNNPDSAIETIKKAKPFINSVKQNEEYWSTRLVIANSLWQKRNTVSAIALYNEVVDSTNNIGLKQIAIKGTFQLAEIYTVRGKPLEANRILLKHLSIRNEFELKQRKLQKNSPASSLERKLDAYQREAKLQNLIIEKEETRRNLLLILVAITLPLLVLISFLLVGRIRASKVLALRNKQIEQQNEELNTINEQLLHSQHKLMRLNQTKDKFFSIVAHDLKSPLVALKTSVYNMRQSMQVVENTQHGNLSVLEEALTNTINLLNNLLFWALSQEDSIEFQPEEFNVAECLEVEVTNAKLIASHKNIALKIDIPKSLQVETDLNMFLFIFRNILSNALKFTPEQGKIFVTTAINSNNISVTISDTGKGMTTEELNSLFEISEEKFRGKKRTNSGTGLGLLLSKEFAAKMGGTIVAKSEVDNGTVFTISIPNK